MTSQITTDAANQGGHPGVDSAQFKEALAHFASGVTIVTARDSDGGAHGFTATAFCAVSMRPPLICVCVARSARCYPVFASRESFAVNLLRSEHAPLALQFGRRNDSKFAHGRFRYVGRDQVFLDDALAVLACTVFSRHEAGDHMLLLGEVGQVEMRAGDPLVFYHRDFRRLVDPPTE